MRDVARALLGPLLPTARRLAARHRARVFASRSPSLRLWLGPYVLRRRFHAYGLGLPKSGTHSVDGLFARRYRSMHEADAEAMVDMIIAASEETISAQEMTRRILRRDRYRQLELDSSLYNFFVLDVLVREFPEARFLLTIRHPVGWADSLFDQMRVRGQAPFEVRFTEWMNQPDRFAFSRHDRVLEEHGLYPLDLYLDFWARHTRTVLSTVPAERLLAIRIDEINDVVPRLSRFLGIAPESLDGSRSHLFQGPGTKLRLLSRMDRGFVRERVEAHCGDLISALHLDTTPATRHTEGAALRS